MLLYICYIKSWKYLIGFGVGLLIFEAVRLWLKSRGKYEADCVKDNALTLIDDGVLHPDYNVATDTPDVQGSHFQQMVFTGDMELIAYKEKGSNFYFF